MSIVVVGVSLYNQKEVQTRILADILPKPRKILSGELRISRLQEARYEIRVMEGLGQMGELNGFLNLIALKFGFGFEVPNISLVPQAYR